jgi:hypothetical protein
MHEKFADILVVLRGSRVLDALARITGPRMSRICVNREWGILDLKPGVVALLRSTPG